jgi:hypothetical protein
LYLTSCNAITGQPVPFTWTTLADTANAGSSNIILQDPVTWRVGDEIVIATTSHHHSQIENEKHMIASISADNTTLTLERALSYTHIGITETLGGVNVDFRAEVGLLTHNVVVRGHRDPQWDELIEACPEGFDTGKTPVHV